MGDCRSALLEEMVDILFRVFGVCSVYILAISGRVLTIICCLVAIVGVWP